MEVSDGCDLDCGSGQLFLAAAVRCELGAGVIFPRAACRTGGGVFGGLSFDFAVGGLLAYSFGLAVVGPTYPCPQGLKPGVLLAMSGTAEPCPSQNRGVGSFASHFCTERTQRW